MLMELHLNKFTINLCNISQYFMSINLGDLKGIKGLIIFEIFEWEFCADIQNIVAIIKPAECRKLYKENLISAVEFKGLKFSIIDLKNKIFGFKPSEFDRENRVILFEMFGKQFCFFVKSVIEILTTDRIFTERTLDFIPASDKNYIRSQLKYQDRIIHIPDFEALVKELKFNG